MRVLSTLYMCIKCFKYCLRNVLRQCLSQWLLNPVSYALETSLYGALTPLFVLGYSKEPLGEEFPSSNWPHCWLFRMLKHVWIIPLQCLSCYCPQIWNKSTVFEAHLQTIIHFSGAVSYQSSCFLLLVSSVVSFHTSIVANTRVFRGDAADAKIMPAICMYQQHVYQDCWRMIKFEG